MKRAALSLILLCAVLLAACAPTPVKRDTTRLVMGTLVTITTFAPPSAMEEKAVRAAFNEMERIEALMSSHRPDSAVSRINQAPRGHWQEAPAELALLLARAIALQKQTRGAFDPGLWPLSDLWGFSREPAPSHPPAPEAIAHIMTLRREQGTLIQLEGQRVMLPHDGIGIDLGAIAKGYAIDRAAETLLAQGIDNFIVNAGGDLRASGRKGEKPWRVGVRHPRQGQHIAAVVDMSAQESLVTSGDYERFFLFEGKRFHHILDPRTGWPAASGLISVSVRARDALSADALCTAAFVLGEKEALAVMKEGESLFMPMVEEMENN